MYETRRWVLGYYDFWYKFIYLFILGNESPKAVISNKILLNNQIYESLLL